MKKEVKSTKQLLKEIDRLRKRVSELERVNESRKENLRLSEERFRSLIEKCAEGVAILDDRGKVIFCSSAIERMTGYRDEDSLASDLEPADFKK
jgi:PAS domain-containing protein